MHEGFHFCLPSIVPSILIYALLPPRDIMIDDLHKTDMWNWCFLGRPFLLLMLLLLSIFSSLQYGHRCLSRLLFGHG